MTWHVVHLAMAAESANAGGRCAARGVAGDWRPRQTCR